MRLQEEKREERCVKQLEIWLKGPGLQLVYNNHRERAEGELIRGRPLIDPLLPSLGQMCDFIYRPRSRFKESI